MAHAVVQHGERQEVLDARPDPPRVGQQAHGGPGEHVHERQDGEQEGGRVLVHAHVLGVGGQEDDGREEAQEHDAVAGQVDEEAAGCLKSDRVQVLVHRLPGGPLLMRGHGGVEGGGGGGGQLLVLLGLGRRRPQRPHEGPRHAAVEQQAPPG